MRPAFSSTKQAAAFALLVLVLVLSPMLAGKKFLPPRGEIYSSTSLRYGPTQFLHRQIFEEKSDIDIAFIGSSRMMYGIDTPYVQEQLSKKLGRPAVVVTLGWSWAGFDALYFVTHDLLAHRNVHLIVFTAELLQEDYPHRAAAHWFRLGDNAESLAGLPLNLQAAYYFGAILGMPRNALSLIRPNINETVPWEVSKLDREHAPDRLGASLVQLAYGDDPTLVEDPAFSPYTPQNGVNASNVCVYAPTTKDAFQFGHSAAPLQLHYARQFGELVAARQIPLVCLHIPVTNDIGAMLIQEREFWPDVVATNLTVMGIPPPVLFSGLSDLDALRLFCNPLHLNRNGQQYFTRLITPRLLEIYDAQVKP